MTYSLSPSLFSKLRRHGVAREREGNKEERDNNAVLKLMPGFEAWIWLGPSSLSSLFPSLSRATPCTRITTISFSPVFSTQS
jgi:hypothetical protein